ncbi:MAG: cytochrome c oxidase subunit II [SAR202 cluster bacterium Casp-Chloro-G4]|nr:cytochrome c oxidase subunit II [Chloroflexota bacterium]MDA1227963.1 cytochrome c oxidase subunit II [Chloroflexota bacterium]PKB61052.1 MAG: cytochrome c oxidase subunit II [SAR202 cluster bacterium Casp-Chloro-G4]
MLSVKQRSRQLVSFTVIGAMLALVLGCTPSNPQSTFDALGPIAEMQLFVFNVIFWIGAVVFVLVEGALVYIIVKFRRRLGDGDPVQTHGNTRMEIAWTIAPVIILIIAAVPTIQGIFLMANSPLTPAQGGLELDAIGHQWWFEFRYPNPNDPNQQIVFANELHMPVGEPVNINLRSVDVIHSFWIPKMGGKVDMVPNNDNGMWLQANSQGEFYGQCAEFCGVSHANMRFKVIVESRDSFNAWLQAQAVPAPDPIDALALQGKELFRSAGCTGCHATNSVMNLAEGGRRLPGRVGPNLSHVASRLYLAGLLPNKDEGSLTVNDALLQQNLKTWLSDPDDVKPGNIMTRDAKVYSDPDSKLEEREIDALVAYLLTLN